MKYDNSLLIGRMAEKGYNQRKMAQALGLTPQTFSKKIRNVTEFTRTEIFTMVRLLGIDNPEPYFFRT